MTSDTHTYTVIMTPEKGVTMEGAIDNKSLDKILKIVFAADVDRTRTNSPDYLVIPVADIEGMRKQFVSEMMKKFIEENKSRGTLKDFYFHTTMGITEYLAKQFLDHFIKTYGKETKKC